ncbi:MAG TPA: hypothetical protein PLD87_13615, partial [Bacteroidia bacterium]|nr:hypothetical protein [Bacteroidia bacterium]
KEIKIGSVVEVINCSGNYSCKVGDRFKVTNIFTMPGEREKTYCVNAGYDLFLKEHQVIKYA